MAILVILLVIAILTLPWWAVTLVVLVITPYRTALPYLFGAGLILDIWYGAPISSLGGFAFIYTTLFVAMGLGASLVRSRVID